MIDEKKLIEEFEKWHDSIENSMSGDFVRSILKVVIGKIKGQPKVGEWIPCSEKLPEEAGFYIVTKRQKSGEIQVALGSYRPLFNEWSGNGNFKDVLAWMPLPEPYREDDES